MVIDLAPLNISVTLIRRPNDPTPPKLTQSKPTSLSSDHPPQPRDAPFVALPYVLPDRPFPLLSHGSALLVLPG
jgi:hypothetical protein